MTTVDLPLLPLGRGTDLTAERGVECPGDLPAAVRPRPGGARPRPRRRRWASGCSCSATTTSATRSSSSPTSPATRSSSPARRPARPEAEYIVFCGVHFMAESRRHPHRADQQVILPDLAAGCSMADMARARAGRGLLGRARRRRRRRQRRPGHLHELLRRHQGVLRPQRRRRLHVEQRRGRARVGLRAEAGREGALPPRPAPRPQHRGAEAGHDPRRLRGLGPATSPAAASTAEAAARRRG